MPQAPHALYTLILGAVIFILGYTLVISCLSLASPLQTGQYYLAQSINGYQTQQNVNLADFNVYNETGSVVVSYNNLTGYSVTLNEETIKFIWHTPYSYFITIGPIPESFTVESNYHYFRMTNPTPLTNEQFITIPDLIGVYDTVNDQAIIKTHDDQLVLQLTFKSNSTSKTLLQALSSHDPIKISYGGQPDFSSMGGNFWTALNKFLTFHAVDTGIAIIDLTTNLIVTTPIYIALFYIGYRLIAGLIPFISGGGSA